jgi:enamine deaminase RidA (YjgF/YER057c/UK114 family)
VTPSSSVKAPSKPDKLVEKETAYDRHRTQRVGPRLSRARAYRATVYLAGQVADDPAADAAGQTEQNLRKIDRLPEGAGTDKSRLLSATIWLSAMANCAT